MISKEPSSRNIHVLQRKKDWVVCENFVSRKTTRILSNHGSFDPIGRKNRHQHIKCGKAAEIFAGRSSVWHAYNANGHYAHRFDTRVDVKQNIHEYDGAYLASCQIVEVHPQEGVALFEPTCSSWIWLTRGVSLRGVVAWMQGARFWWDDQIWEALAFNSIKDNWVKASRSYISHSYFNCLFDFALSSYPGNLGKSYTRICGGSQQHCGDLGRTSYPHLHMALHSFCGRTACKGLSNGQLESSIKLFE